MLGIDDPLVAMRAIACEDAPIDVLPLGAAAYVRRADARDGFPLDEHDVACFRMWTVVVLADVTIFPGQGARTLRPWTAETRRPIERSHAHWKREHADEDRRAQAQQLYPEAPV